MKTNKPAAKKQLHASQRRYLYQRYVFLYLHSVQARHSFEALVSPKPQVDHALEHARATRPRASKQPVAPPEKQVSNPMQPHPVLVATPGRWTLIHRVVGRIRHSKAFGAVVFAAVLTLAVQIAYPSDRALPFSRLDGNGYIGFSTQQEILARFQNFDDRRITVHTHTKNITSSYSDLGVTLKPEATLQSVKNYPLSQRLIPFSIFVVGNKSHTMSRDLNEEQLALFVRDVVAEGNASPVDATISIEGTNIVLNPSQPGYEYQAAYLKSLVLRSDLSDQAQLVFKPTVLPPRIQSEEIAPKVARMQQRINTPLIITAENSGITVDSATLASWVEVSNPEGQSTLELSFSKPKIKQSLARLAANVDVRMQPTVVTMLNGLQAGRNQGIPGKVLQLDELVEKVSNATAPTVQTVVAPVTTVAPSEALDRRYTKDSAGLQNLLEYWVSNRKGQFSIDVRSTNGKIQASINSNKLTSAVGVHRLYIAHNIYGRIAAKSLSSSAQTSAGLSVGSCLDRMVREADEACTNALGDIVGWGASDSLLQSQGFLSTTLTQGASLTTVNDLSQWMLQVLNGSLTTKAHGAELTNMMKNSNQRSGIPAGSSGISVANRASSVGRYKHDAGIVYHPNGTYVVAVLSDGSDFSQIADLAREIRKVMDQ